LVRDDEDFDRVASAAVTTAMRISGAVKGNLQLFDADSGALKIAAHQGFDAGFLQFFEYVRNDGSACAAAMRSGQRIIIDDVAKSEIFAGQPSRQVMLDAQALAVISTPLMSSKNTLLGMISVHFNKPHQPRDAELHRLDLLARQVSDYLERKRAEQVETTLMRELQHRSNNLLAVVQAMAHRSFSDSGIPADAKMRFEQRLQALARANRRLTNSNWTNVDLTELVNGELEYLPARTRVTGPTVSLQAQLVQKFTLVLHELSTNAVKHGAMAVPDGTLTATWSVTHNGNGRVLCFRWEERGRSQAAAPGKGGFGAQLITTSFPEARTHYGDAGFTWEVEVPLKGDNDPAAFAALRSAIEQHTMP